MKISYFRHATAERVPELERRGFELVSFVYYRGGQACFLMRERQQSHPPREPEQPTEVRT